MLRAQLDNFDDDRHASDLDCSADPTLAQQHFKDECDINTLVERFHLTGEMPQVIEKLPSASDYEGIFDFQSAMNAIVAAQRQFMTFPAKLRARFENDPQQLLEFLEDTENREEAERLGLIEKKPEPAPAPQPVATAPVPPKT